MQTSTPSRFPYDLVKDHAAVRQKIHDARDAAGYRNGDAKQQQRKKYDEYDQHEATSFPAASTPLVVSTNLIMVEIVIKTAPIGTLMMIQP